MGKTFSEIFGNGFCEELSLAEIIGMNIDMDKREVAAKIAPKQTDIKKIYIPHKRNFVKSWA